MKFTTTTLLLCLTTSALATTSSILSDHGGLNFTEREGGRPNSSAGALEAGPFGLAAGFVLALGAGVFL
jgi:hypothetical protein